MPEAALLADSAVVPHGHAPRPNHVHRLRPRAGQPAKAEPAHAAAARIIARPAAAARQTRTPPRRAAVVSAVNSSAKQRTNRCSASKAHRITQTMGSTYVVCTHQAAVIVSYVCTVFSMQERVLAASLAPPLDLRHFSHSIASRLVRGFMSFFVNCRRTGEGMFKHLSVLFYR